MKKQVDTHSKMYLLIYTVGHPIIKSVNQSVRFDSVTKRELTRSLRPRWIAPFHRWIRPRSHTDVRLRWLWVPSQRRWSQQPPSQSRQWPPVERARHCTKCLFRESVARPPPASRWGRCGWWDRWLDADSGWSNLTLMSKRKQENHVFVTG